MSQVPFPSRTVQVSGATIITAFSGQGVFLGALFSPLAASTVSYSGSVIRILDAISGIVGAQSGQALFVNIDFGVSSGLTNGINTVNTQVMAQNLPYCEGFCNSGLIIQGATGWQTTVFYNK